MACSRCIEQEMTLQYPRGCIEAHWITAAGTHREVWLEMENSGTIHVEVATEMVSVGDPAWQGSGELEGVGLGSAGNPRCEGEPAKGWRRNGQRGRRKTQRA